MSFFFEIKSKYKFLVSFILEFCYIFNIFFVGYTIRSLKNYKIKKGFYNKIYFNFILPKKKIIPYNSDGIMPKYHSNVFSIGFSNKLIVN